MGKIILAVIIFAVVTYLLVRLVQEISDRRRRGGKPAPRKPRGPRGAPQIIPPDDDTDFLRDLQRKRKRDAQKKPDEPEA